MTDLAQAVTSAAAVGNSTSGLAVHFDRGPEQIAQNRLRDARIGRRTVQELLGHKNIKTTMTQATGLGMLIRQSELC